MTPKKKIKENGNKICDNETQICCISNVLHLTMQSLADFSSISLLGYNKIILTTQSSRCYIFSLEWLHNMHFDDSMMLILSRCSAIRCNLLI